MREIADLHPPLQSERLQIYADGSRRRLNFHVFSIIGVRQPMKS